MFKLPETPDEWAWFIRKMTQEQNQKIKAKMCEIIRDDILKFLKNYKI